MPHSVGIRQNQPLTIAAVLAGMLLYPALALYNPGPDGNAGIVLLAGMAAYFLAIFIFFGVATLAYRNRYGFLIAGFAGALAIGLTVAGVENALHVILVCGAVFATSYAAGIMIRQNKSGLWVYVLGLVVLAVFTIVEFAPKWPDMMKATSELGNSLAKDFETSLMTGDRTPATIESYRQAFKDGIDFLVRLLPASVILSAFTQFSIGFMIFLIATVRRATGRSMIVPFIFWKIPFALMPVAVVAMALRLIGGESLALVADNALAVLAIFYAVAGLAIVEFSFIKLQFPIFMKILFYILLFFTQFIGLMLMVGLGFIDSFADWRKVEPPKITVDN